MTINEKISKIRDAFCNGDNGVFATRLGVSTQYASNICKNGKNVGEKQKQHILDVFHDVSRSWLLAGEGTMLKSESISEKDADFRLVPMYNLDARGGFGGNEEVDVAEYIVDYIPFKDAKQGDICVPIIGNSMAPTYCAGAIVLLHRVEQWADFLELGQVYMIVLKDGRRLIKELRASQEDRKSKYLCVSHNPTFDPVELPKDMISRIFLVRAVYAKTAM